MTYRQFNDGDGRLWEVWEVRPAAIERRQAEDRRRHLRDFSDRRRGGLELTVLGELAEGWLTFQSGAERFRLAPIPEGWTHLTDATLIALMDKARPVGRTGLPASVSGFGRIPGSDDLEPS